MILSILSDAFFAAIAGIGFGAISNPSRRAFPYIGILAALGHACRFSLMNFCGFDIAAASLVGAFVVGMGSLLLGKRTRMPMTVLYIPALLPMIPGKYAYNMVFSLIMFFQSIDDVVTRNNYMDMFFFNTVVAVVVIFLLAVGATFPLFIFPKVASSLTRKHNKA